MIKNLWNIGLKVSDLDREVDFLRNLGGLRASGLGDFEPHRKAGLRREIDQSVEAEIRDLTAQKVIQARLRDGCKQLRLRAHELAPAPSNAAAETGQQIGRACAVFGNIGKA